MERSGCLSTKASQRGSVSGSVLMTRISDSAVAGSSFIPESRLQTPVSTEAYRATTLSFDGNQRKVPMTMKQKAHCVVATSGVLKS